MSNQKFYAQNWLFQWKERIKSSLGERVFFVVVLTLASLIATGQKITDPIRLNQVGYYPNSAKVAIITGKVWSGYFYVVSADGKDTLYYGPLGDEKKSEFSSTVTRIADFSSFGIPGDYILRVPNLKQSFPFAIKNDVYAELGKGILKSFYYQRSSIALEEKYAGKWSRAAKHSGNAVIIRPSSFVDNRGSVIAAPGGWYDKGDYGKCIVSSGLTMSTLLSAYEDFSGHFDSVRTNIPESTDRIPDILNEVLFNLRWMFAMQDPFDGGVYYQCSNIEYNGSGTSGLKKMPEVVQKTTASTLDFAAVMAQAGRVFKTMKTLPGLADSCLRASANAWYWALKHPNVDNDPSMSDGEYLTVAAIDGHDRQLGDEWIWAATEMFVTSKNKMYFEVIEQNIDDSVCLPSCCNVRMLAYYTMLRYQEHLPEYTRKTIETMRQRLINMADAYLMNSSSNAFATVMGQSKNDFVWGSNAVAAKQGILLINAFFITGDQKYIHGAMSNLDYLLGRNATGYCFVTGCYGSKSPLRPYRVQSTGDETREPVPGLLVAGPNPGRQDKCRYPLADPETAYVDSDRAFASNGIDINWNAAMAYLVHAVEAMQYGLGFSKSLDAVTTLR